MNPNNSCQKNPEVLHRPDRDRVSDFRRQARAAFRFVRGASNANPTSPQIEGNGPVRSPTDPTGEDIDEASDVSSPHLLAALAYRLTRPRRTNRLSHVTPQNPSDLNTRPTLKSYTLQPELPRINQYYTKVTLGNVIVTAATGASQDPKPTVQIFCLVFRMTVGL